ncbi:MAG: type IV pili methyl-accepting chemotaxis transducer N-terminal domain-containing protein [Arcobacter sp.]|jgi:nitrate/nitrite-specific signal transduction histidine kinase|uniref:type IV pili methyl-accepting chemotaxis transducer N-terminal domain-containing protein n=1 Tax=Arcobacter sp. TaxID=1872629 RepID=UPI00258DD622|nr:type IV pili methyl-accepting chemotaxis transducer N-terminal domain-containing protein [Arcobacter sp.]MDD3007524.1 type IV pili methyl-accepting chemotaxis transducer N-terminal domain-containing protein [Arcobacter sp.]MDY3203509.1 type IV pili methyl-accepting chemotaxis transducer N-terminal domain-containing protein [Arcobacter sp.]
MNKNKISTKIKSLGILFFVLMLSVIATTIYLNNKNKKDALIINIAGKQRMLTQNISKNIFYLSQHKNSSFVELENSTTEFIYNLNSLKEGNELSEIQKAPTKEIANQIMKIEILWKSFFQNIIDFKELINKNDSSSKNSLENIIDLIYTTNPVLLEEVDKLVYMYTIYSEEKTNDIRYMQYFFALLIVILIIYGFIQLKSMEENAKKFLEESKKIVEQNVTKPLTPIKIEGENEIVEATHTINCFIEKINSVMNYSANAIEQSKNASLKLEELTDEFDKIIYDLTNSADISKQLNRSEDIVIQSQEYLINSTKRLQELKKELDKILKSCNNSVSSEA